MAMCVKCDRCGYVGECFSPNFKSIDVEHGPRFDICMTCYNKLLSFLKGESDGKEVKKDAEKA